MVSTRGSVLREKADVKAALEASMIGEVVEPVRESGENVAGPECSHTLECASTPEGKGAEKDTSEVSKAAVGGSGQPASQHGVQCGLAPGEVILGAQRTERNKNSKTVVLRYPKAETISENTTKLLALSKLTSADDTEPNAEASNVAINEVPATTNDSPSSSKPAPADDAEMSGDITEEVTFVAALSKVVKESTVVGRKASRTTSKGRVQKPSARKTISAKRTVKEHQVVKYKGKQIGIAIHAEKDEDFTADTATKNSIVSAFNQGHATRHSPRNHTLQKVAKTKQARRTSISAKEIRSTQVRKSRSTKEAKSETTGTRSSQVQKTQNSEDVKAQTTKITTITRSRKPKDPTKPKKIKVEYSNKYQVKFGYSRYPAGTGPTVDEVWKVFEILREHHKKDDLKLERDVAPVDGAAAAGPLHATSEVTVDAFVMTILSQTTTNAGALSAYYSLRRYFPYVVNGRKVMGKKPNYHDMLTADVGMLIDILRPAGLQFKKAHVIKNILKAVSDMNVTRQKAEDGIIVDRRETQEDGSLSAQQAELTSTLLEDDRGNPDEFSVDAEAGVAEEDLDEQSNSPVQSQNDTADNEATRSAIVTESFVAAVPDEMAVDITSPASTGSNTSELTTPPSSPDSVMTELAVDVVRPDSSSSSITELTTPPSSPDSVTAEVTVPDTISEQDVIARLGILRGGDVYELPLKHSPDFVPGMLSVTYLQTLEDQALFDELVSHDGVGVKTAACVMAFNLGRPVFAVDIHVYRLCKFLGWSPQGLKEDRTCELLDAIVPNEIKYGLHQAFWHHGQFCGRCKSGAGEKSAGWEKGCPIEEIVDRSRYVPEETKQQKIRKVEKAAEAEKAAAERKKAEKAAARKAKVQAKKSGQQNLVTEGVAAGDKPKAGQPGSSETVKPKRQRKSPIANGVTADEDEDANGPPKVRAARPRKRKAEAKEEGHANKEDGEATDVEAPKVKKSRVAKAPAEEDLDVEWAEIELHDDFDAGRNQNITRVHRFKVPKITMK